MTATHQCGYSLRGSDYHAGTWAGTAASWVDLQPAGLSYSVCYGMTPGYQVGEATVGGLLGVRQRLCRVAIDAGAFEVEVTEGFGGTQVPIGVGLEVELHGFGRIAIHPLPQFQPSPSRQMMPPASWVG